MRKKNTGPSREVTACLGVAGLIVAVARLRGTYVAYYNLEPEPTKYTTKKQNLMWRT